MTNLSLHNRKWSLIDKYNGGRVVVTIIDGIDATGTEPVTWELARLEAPFGGFSKESPACSLLAYLEQCGAKKHWTVGA